MGMSRRLTTAVIVAVLWTTLVGSLHASTVRVDFKDAQEPLNRNLFSVVGMAEFLAYSNDVAMAAFDQLNLRGSQARLETQSHSVEPVNDNDDPFTFNWDGFHFEYLFRFQHGDPKAFIDIVRSYGQEPVLLLAYNHRWNSESGATASAPVDVEEWAEWAAAVVEFFNGRGDDYELNIRYVEIWNEPNHHWFWEGPRDTYFDLFEAAARRIHRHYPGVLVGGPSLSPEGEFQDFMETFLKRNGESVDFLTYHVYRDSAEQIADTIKYWVGRFREIPGKEELKVMITEADRPTLFGLRKQEHLMRRQFELMDIADLVEGFHHFYLSYYDENGTIFGLIDARGPILDYNYWPYWIFRDLAGDLVDVYSDDDSLRTAATHDAQTGRANVVIYHDSNRSQGQGDKLVELLAEFGSDHLERRAVISRIGTANGVVDVLSVPPGTSELHYETHLRPGDVVSVMVEPISNDPGLYVAHRIVRETAAPLIMGDAVVLEAELVNLTNREQQVRVTPVLEGAQRTTLPVEAITLAPFSTEQIAVTAPLDHPGPEGYIVYVTAETESNDRYYSHAEWLPVTAPLEIFATGAPPTLRAGESTSLRIALRNTHVRTLTGQTRLQVPPGWSAEPESVAYEIGQKRAGRLDYTVFVPEATPTGTYTLSLQTSYGHVTLDLPVVVTVSH